MLHGLPQGAGEREVQTSLQPPEHTPFQSIGREKVAAFAAFARRSGLIWLHKERPHPPHASQHPRDLLFPHRRRQRMHATSMPRRLALPTFTSPSCLGGTCLPPENARSLAAAWCSSEEAGRAAADVI